MKEHQKFEQFADILENEYMVATYRAIVEKCLGSYGLRLLEELLQNIRENKFTFPSCEGKPGPLEDDKRDDIFQEEMLRAFEIYGISIKGDDESNVPCRILCQSDFVTCMKAADLLPGWKERIIMQLACGFKLLGCLAKC